MIETIRSFPARVFSRLSSLRVSARRSLWQTRLASMFGSLLTASTLPSSAKIGVANSHSLHGTTSASTYTKSFNADATADKLIISASYEGVPHNSALTTIYNGEALTKVPGRLGNRNEGIWHLDLATPGISWTNVVVDLRNISTLNGLAAGWVPIDGNLAADPSNILHRMGTCASQSNTVDLKTTGETFNLVNFNGNNKNGTVAVDAPNPMVICTDADIGSARRAAAYDGKAAAGTTSTFTHPQNGSPPEDLGMLHQWSPNLIDWYACDGVNGSLTGQTESVSSNTTHTTTTVTASSSGNERAFPATRSGA